MIITLLIFLSFSGLGPLANKVSGPGNSNNRDNSRDNRDNRDNSMFNQQQNNPYNNQQQQRYNQYGGGGQQQQHNQQQQYGSNQQQFRGGGGGGYNQQQNYQQHNPMVRYPNPASMGYNNQYGSNNSYNSNTMPAGYGGNYSNQNYQNYQQQHQNYNQQNQYNSMGNLGQQQQQYQPPFIAPQQQPIVQQPPQAVVQQVQPQIIQQHPQGVVVQQQPATQLASAGGFLRQLVVQAAQPAQQAVQQAVAGANAQPSYILASSNYQNQNSFVQPAGGGVGPGGQPMSAPGGGGPLPPGGQQQVFISAAPPANQPQLVQTIQPGGVQTMQPVTVQPGVQFVQAAPQQLTSAIVITDPMTCATPALISAPTPTPIVVNTSGMQPVSSAYVAGMVPSHPAHAHNAVAGAQLIDPSQQLALLHSQQQHQAQHLKKMKQRLPHVSGRELQALHKQIKELQIKQQHQTLQTLRLAKAQEKQAFKYLDSALKGRSGGAPRNASLYRVGFQLKVGIFCSLFNCM